jgi:hypothetical protein
MDMKPILEKFLETIELPGVCSFSVLEDYLGLQVIVIIDEEFLRRSQMRADFLAKGIRTRIKREVQNFLGLDNIYIGSTAMKCNKLNESISENTELIGQRVMVYYNLHKLTFSIMNNNKVVAHADFFKLSDVEFRVRKGGKEKVRSEKRKNVHAFVIGTLEDYCEFPCEELPEPSSDVVITYNPYKNDTFVEKNTDVPVLRANTIEMINLKDKVFKLNEQFEPFGEKMILKIFSILDKEKKQKKTKKELMSVLDNLAPYLNIPEGFSLYLLELYLLNYRKDGDYSNLTRETVIDPRSQRGKTTSNTKAWMYAKAQLPFKGSNLEGYWSNDLKGNNVYIVKSYRWYPIYIFRDGQWYETLEKYSSSTSRQMSNANPVEWSNELQDEVIMLTQKEMNDVLKGLSKEEIIRNKMETLKSKEPELKSKRVTTVKPWTGFWQDNPVTPISIKYKINSVNIEGDKAVVVVDILDVMERVGQKSIPTPENYRKGEIPGITEKYVEEKLRPKLHSSFEQYIGPRFTHDEELSDIHNIKFKFNHLKQ